MNILYVASSILGTHSKSDEIARELLDQLAAGVRATVVRRDASKLPHIDAALLAAVGSDKPEAALADKLIGETEQADTIVIGAPMYNFSVSSGLKAWIDHIARAGRTFRYSATGPEGLLKGKKVYVVTSRGGLYANDGPAAAMDFQEPYLRAVLGFLGLTDVTFIYVEGQAMGAESAMAGLAAARRQLAELEALAKAA